MTWRDRCLVVIAIWNSIVFLTYGLDKRKAIQSRWRIPEKVLLVESWLLGGFGALLGGYLFHHKVRKWYFQATWWGSSLLLAGALFLILQWIS